MISAYLANARATQIKIEIELSFIQHILVILCPKMPIVSFKGLPELTILFCRG